jgi:hypothetical protein
LFGPLAGDVRDATPHPIAVTFCATIWIHKLSPLYLTTLGRAFDDLDGDSCASGQATAAPAIIYFYPSCFAFLSSLLIDVVPERPLIVLRSGRGVCFDVLGRLERT